nr:DPM/DPG synthase family glycosyltransferase [Methanolinea mesophila]
MGPGKNDKEDRSDHPDISIILPAMNEELTIGRCIERIRDGLSRCELSAEIVVSDSSSDRTPEIARSMGARVVHPKNRGYGNAYLEGFRASRGGIIVIGDSDGTYDFSELPRLVAPILKGADLVVGSRFQGTMEKGSMPALHYYIGNPLLTKILNLAFKTNYSDTHSGFRAITRTAWESLNLRSTGMEFASEMLVMASINGLKVAEVPISYSPRVAASKLHSFADGWRHLRFLFLLKPIPFLAIPGLLFSLMGVMLMGIFSLYGDVNQLHLNTFILGAFFLIGGVQFVLSAISIKTYSVVHGYDRMEGVAKYLMNYYNLEKMLVIGGILIFAGILLGSTIVADWISTGYGVLNQFSQAVTALLLTIVGLQVILTSIFVSMMLLNESSIPGE